MNRYLQAISEYFNSKSYYMYEDSRTGEVFTYKRKGIYKKNGRTLTFVKYVRSAGNQEE
jgi:hypothetical protein